MGRGQRLLLSWVVTLTVVAFTAGAVYHPGAVVVAPGPSFDVTADITIRGIPTQRPTGRYLLTTVSLSKPNVWRTLWSWLRGDADVEAGVAERPAAIAPEMYDRWQRDLFDDSRQLAAVAAARANGMAASVTGTGATVLGVTPSTPASVALCPGDTIVAVDGVIIPTARDLADAVAGQPPGFLFELTVERDGARRLVSVQSASAATGGVAGLGAVVDTRDLRAVLPFQISFVDRPDIGGPSAGLAYALAINDMLDATDDARSRSIAATGTIDATGRVGAVAGVAEKVVAAKHAGATLLIVPDGLLRDVDPSAIAATSVTDLREALRVLTAA